MPVKWEVDSGNLGVFRITGKLIKDEYVSAQNEAEALIRKLGSIKILVLLEDFSGWERTSAWEDLSFNEQNDPFIEKMAIVGHPQWQDLVYAFTLKGLRSVPIEYFASEDESKARQWLAGD